MHTHRHAPLQLRRAWSVRPLRPHTNGEAQPGPGRPMLEQPAAKETEVTFTNTDPRPRPEGVLTVTGELTQEQADAVLAEWEKFLADNPTDGAYTIAGVEVTY